MKKRIFKTASKYYQLEFISLFKKLIALSPATSDFHSPMNRFGYRMAFYLLRNLNLVKHRNEYFKSILQEVDGQKRLPQITKIVAVTLSSHILAEEVRDLYIRQENLGKSAHPILIKLTNYYSFESDDAFSQIESGDNVLIVNDVISTGKLNKQLHDSITKIGGNVIAIFSIFDTRKPLAEYKEGDVPHFYDETIQQKLICLYEKEIDKFYFHEINKKVKEYKAQNKIEETIELVHVPINPILNSPAEVISKSDEIYNKLIWTKKESDYNTSFLQRLDENILHVGHIEHFKSHNPYFIDTVKYLKTEKGIKHLYDTLNRVQFLDLVYQQNINIHNVDKALERLSRFKGENDVIKDCIRKIEKIKRNDNSAESLESILSLLNGINNHINQQEIENVINLLFKENEKLSAKVRAINVQAPKDIYLKNQELFHSLVDKEFDIDFVIHAGESGFDNISRRIFTELLRKKKNPNSFQILRLPRMMMNHEWGIPFFANYFSETFLDKTVLILEDVSSSGETLLKVIDSVCYLNVKKVIVLSFITRMKDYQGEFLSRVHKISNNNDNPNKSSIPIDIYFGSYLNMPSYFANSKDCPHCKGYQQYEKQNKITNLPKPVKAHLEKGLEILKTRKYSEIAKSDSSYIIEYLPKELDLKKMYEYRDYLGNLLTQETSNKIFINYSNEQREIEIGYTALDLEIYMAIILHEPNFLDIIKDNLKNLYYSLLLYVNACTINSSEVSSLTRDILDSDLRKYRTPRAFIYKWRDDSVAFLMNELDAAFYYLNSINLLKLINYVSTPDGFNQVMYKLWFIYEEDIAHRDNFLIYLSEFINENTEHLNAVKTGAFHELVEYFSINSSSITTGNSYFKLLLFYCDIVLSPRHTYLNNLLVDFSYEIMPKSEVTKNDFDSLLRNLDSELIGHIKRIIKNPFIEKNFKNIIDTLATNPDSILHNYEILKELLNQLREDKDNPTLQNKAFVQLNEFTKKYITKDSALYAYFSNLIILEPITYFEMQYQKKQSDLNKNNLYFTFNPSEQCAIIIHKDFFSKVISNIFSNCEIHNRHHSENVTIKIYSFSKGQDEICICVEQDKPIAGISEVIDIENSAKLISSTKLFTESLKLFNGHYSTLPGDTSFKQFLVFKNINSINHE